MVCRDSRLSSAYVTFARDMSGLEDNQCLGLNHALMQEGASTDAPTPAEWNALIDRTIADYRSGRLQINRGSRNPVARLEQARTETPDGARFYAITRLVQRSRVAATSQVGYFNSYARDLGVPASHVSVEFWSHFADATENGRLQPTPAFVRAFESNPDNSGLMVDRRSMYAYEQMEIGRANRTLAQESRPAVTRTVLDEDMSSAIAEVGHNAAMGRVEIVMRSNPDHVYAYRMSEEEYLAFLGADSLGSYYARHVRGNPAYQYGSAEDQHTGATQHRCATCGQWQGAAHHCPVSGSEEDLNRDIRMAIERSRANVAGASAPATVLEPARMASTRTTRLAHTGTATTTRMPTPNRVRQEARRATQVLVPIQSASAADAAAGESAALVQGNVLVEYNGRGLGYSVRPVTQPGDSGEDNLRCSCPTYRRAYHCEHVDAAVSRVYGALNEDQEAAAPAAVRAAAARASASLPAEHDASVAATDQAVAGWRPVSTSFEDDPAQFQEMYEEFRTARAAWKDAVAEGREDVAYPVPYMTGENVLGGLASRESGRGFGVEIEFSLPDSMSAQQQHDARANIARELYALGLTHNRRQLGYGSSHGVIRTEHARGWSLESDPTVNGGELVSPVMYDEPATWENLDKVVEVITRNGGIASQGSGMHVHVGVGDYDHRVENHNRLLAITQENEDLLYRMSSNPDRGSHRGVGYCGPNRVPASPYTDIGRVRSDHWGHHLAVNMQSVEGRGNDHVEFRTFDGSLRPGVMQAHIGMAVYMAAGATRPGTADLRQPERHPLGERLESNPRRAALSGDEWHESTRGMRRFVDRLVPGTGGDDKANPRVRQMIAVFAMTKWQRRRRNDW